jgi:hypothetical protein
MIKTALNNKNMPLIHHFTKAKHGKKELLI